MSEKNARDVVDEGDVVLLDDQVVHGITVCHHWLADVSRIDPFLPNTNRMLVGDL